MKKILIIEDDEMIAKIYGSTYSAAGFETAVAEDGEVGLQLVKTFQPDVVHLDLGVPKVNGPEIIKQIRRQPRLRLMPLIVLSNTYRNRLVKEALDAGASECVSKAICTPKMMLAIVHKHLARRAAIEDAALGKTRTVAPVAPADPVTPNASDAPAPRAAAPEAGTTPAPTPETGAHRQEMEVLRHADFQMEIRDSFLQRAPRMLAALHDRVVPLLQTDIEAHRLQELAELCGAAEKLSNHAGVAGFPELSRMAAALVALLRELLDKPEEVTASSLRTIVDACDFMVVPAEAPTDGSLESVQPPLVLVVDDDPVIRRSIRLALSRIAVSTITVPDPLAALELAKENRFNLILLDVQMPGMDGFALCKELRKLSTNETTPVVFVTSLEGFESRERTMASGGNDLIAKPFLPMELAVKALSLIRRD